MRLPKTKPVFVQIALIAFFIVSCNQTSNETEEVLFFAGVDLSYVNEMEDCGASFKNRDGVTQDPFKIFADEGANLVRARLWHNPTWTKYSNFIDVEKTIKRAKENNMQVLLDFHYSDDWADPDKQIVPKAWFPVIDNLPVLGDSLYNYTYKTLVKLNSKNLLPEMVQIGNETNIMILQKDDKGEAMNWSRNAFLLNKGIKAVRDVSTELNKDIKVMLHIAQPENGLTWFRSAKENGLTNYDLIGLSYYSKWSSFSMTEAANTIKTLKETYQKDVLIVETSYPFTLQGVDEANNILGEDSLINGYPATEEGQLKYLLDFKRLIKKAGGKGLIYWEPAWISNNCSTRWGKGSHWENATLFDFNGKPTLGFSYLKTDN